MSKSEADVCFLAHNIADVDFFVSFGLRADRQHFFCVRLSTYLYAKLLGLSATGLFLIPIKSSLGMGTGDTIPFDGEFYDSCGMSPGYAQKAIAIYARVFSSSGQKPDIIIFSGKARLVEQAFANAFKNARSLFYEAGPPGYTYFSKTGTNADAEFRFTGFSETKRHFETSCSIGKLGETPKKNKFSKKVLKIFDYLFLNFSKFVLRNPEIVEYLPKKVVFPRLPSHAKNARTKQLLFIGQVELDTNSTHYGADTTFMVRELKKFFHLRKDFGLVLRPHPREVVNQINSALANEFKEICTIDNGGSLLDAINEADLVATVNSTGGLEALRAGKLVWVFGESYYDQLRGARNSIDEVLFDLSQETPDISGQKEGVDRFLRDCFIEVDYRGVVFPGIRGMDDFLANFDR